MRLNDRAYPAAVAGVFFAAILQQVIGQMPIMGWVLCAGVAAYIGHKWPEQRD